MTIQNVSNDGYFSFRRVPLVERELPTISEDLSSPPVFGEVRVAQSLVLCVPL